jgi:hypothetical protein
VNFINLIVDIIGWSFLTLLGVSILGMVFVVAAAEIEDLYYRSWDGDMRHTTDVTSNGDHHWAYCMKCFWQGPVNVGDDAALEAALNDGQAHEDDPDWDRLSDEN